MTEEKIDDYTPYRGSDGVERAYPTALVTFGAVVVISAFAVVAGMIVGPIVSLKQQANADIERSNLSYQARYHTYNR